jgi:hypothetical protein
MNGRASCVQVGRSLNEQHVLDGQRSSGKQKKAAIEIGLELPVDKASKHLHCNAVLARWAKASEKTRNRLKSHSARREQSGFLQTAVPKANSEVQANRIRRAGSLPIQL